MKELPKTLQVEVKKTKWEIAGDVFRTITRSLIFLFILFVIGGALSSSSIQMREYVIETVDWYDNSIFPEVDLTQTDRIALIPIKGMILNEGLAQDGLLGGTTSESVLRMLNDVEQDNSIKVVVLEIDSPGGTVIDSEIIAAKVEDIKKTKTVYALLKSTAASGGYYIASQADKIFAYRDTITGSIGVIMQIPNAKKLMDKVGVEMVEITSGNMKNMGSPFAPFSDDTKQVFQDLADESYESFVARVASGRSMDIEIVKQLADGRIYSGKQAFKNGLIDVLGGKEALKKALESEGYSDAVLYKFSIPLSPFEELFGPMGSTIKSFFPQQNQSMAMFYLM